MWLIEGGQEKRKQEASEEALTIAQMTRTKSKVVVRNIRLVQK